MTREEIVRRLRVHRADLEAHGVMHLALFGSVARGDADATSDIDLAACYDKNKVRSLFDLGEIAGMIADYIGTDHFDLADETRLRSEVRESYGRDHVRIF
jgi:predicted nucleotidyltransferase